MSTSTLEQLRQYTTIVADTGDFNVLSLYKSQDATTNPSHILTASQKPEYAYLLSDAAAYARSASASADEQVDLALQHLLVSFGCKILQHVPGRVSTEVDPIHSFDAAATIAYARRLIALYAERGVAPDRVLVKIASTWEGFQACRVLEQEGIHCNLTLLFGMPQAVLAAEVGATLISPFVGRTLDWWHKNYPAVDYSGKKDPGVIMTKGIWEYYKANGIETEIMGASMRSIDECKELAGLDLMTINVGLLQELKEADVEIKPALVAEKIVKQNVPQPKSYINDEVAFRTDLFNDYAAHDKMTDMMRQFLRDGAATKAALKTLLQA
ncbi:Transaldolase [Macrophomina phaseolina MS6]|uniref:transaldolase n=1 Tax=Macrophomina phaseolina (strain MS6) TaxID=1126212 RepID=K2RK55_MACPH|nr:Transaldolase [Macrophomina phaseolina MS6]